MDEQILSYCPYCGNKYELADTNPHLCEKCKKEYYINPHPCNAVVIENEENEILLVKRKIDPFKGKWDLPGGFINLLETAENSVTREIQEELGITLPSFSYFASYFDRYFYKGINYYTLCFFYRAPLPKRAALKAHDDITSFAFFPKDRIPYKDIAFAGVTWAMKKYRNITR